MERSFILTDDQSIAMDPAGLPLGDMQPMKRTRELLLDGGLHMENCTLRVPLHTPAFGRIMSEDTRICVVMQGL